MKDHKAILHNELKKVQAQITALEMATDAEPNYGLGEGDPGITRREVDRALLERLRERSETLKRAISQHDQGTYGVCAQCGNPIHPDRLAVLPDTKVCIRCAKISQPT
jgi:RNA polymerase-binding transcription factor DksA